VTPESLHGASAAGPIAVATRAIGDTGFAPSGSIRSRAVAAPTSPRTAASAPIASARRR